MIKGFTRKMVKRKIFWHFVVNGWCDEWTTHLQFQFFWERFFTFENVLFLVEWINYVWMDNFFLELCEWKKVENCVPQLPNSPSVHTWPNFTNRFHSNLSFDMSLLIIVKKGRIWRRWKLINCLNEWVVLQGCSML